MPPTYRYAAPIAGSPAGLHSNNGSVIGSPVNLQGAFYNDISPPINAGEVLYIRGGTYSDRSSSYYNYVLQGLVGTNGNPITIMPYPGERVIIDAAGTAVGALIQQDPLAWVTMRGIEFIDSTGTGNPGASGMWMRGGHHLTFIDCIFHDFIQHGVGNWIDAPSTEFYGCIFYFNGTGLPEHGCYTNSPLQGVPVAGGVVRRNFKHCMFFLNAGYGLHAYASDYGDSINFYNVDDCIGFSSGFLNGGSGWGNFLLGTDTGTTGFTSPVGYDVRVANCISYMPNTYTAETYNFGYLWGYTKGQILNNYGSGYAIRWRNVLDGTMKMTGNEFYATEPAVNAVAGWPSGASWPGNTFSSTFPTTNRAFVRPSKYTGGRGHIAIFNYQNLGSQSVDISGIVRNGDSYEIRSAWNYWGTPVASGIYAGGTVSVPLTAAALPMTTPIHWLTPPNPAPGFAAFVVLTTVRR